MRWTTEIKYDMTEFSCYLNRRTRRAAASFPIESLSRDENSVRRITGVVRARSSNVFEDMLQKLSLCALQSFRRKRGRDITSFFTQIYRSDGGYAAIKRRKLLQSEQLQVERGYIYSSGSFAPLEQSFHHNFRLSRQHVSLGSQVAQESINAHDDMNSTQRDEQITIDDSPSRAVAYEPRSRRKMSENQQPRLKKSDEVMFATNLEFFQGHLGTLRNQSNTNRHVRVVHYFRNSRSLAFGSAYMSSNKGKRAVISVLWQTTARPPRAVCVTFSLPDSSANENLVANCTCCHLLNQKKGCDTGCYHAQVCLRNNLFVDDVARHIRRRQSSRTLDESEMVFGQCIDLECIQESSHYLAVFLERYMQKRTKNPWIFFMMFDVDMQLFVPVSKIKRKPFQCMLCRGSKERRGICAHEDGCILACRNMRTQTNGASLLSELGMFDEDEDNSFLSDVEDEVGSDDSDRDDEDNARRNGNQSIRVPEEYYPKGFKRPILPCRGEWNDMRKLSQKIETTYSTGEQLAFDDRLQVCCSKCQTRNTKPRYPNYRRDVDLYTISQGIVKIYVYDWYCDVCREVRRFSGRGCAVFPARRKSCYTTELLYTWLEMTCRQGLSFRTAYDSTRLFGETASIVHRVKKYGARQNVTNSKLYRRRANDAFRAFLRHIDTSSTMVTEKLFSCDNCEVNLSKDDCDDLGIDYSMGKDMKRLKAIVIDGTAAGILTELPNFNRDVESVPPASGGLGAQKLVKKVAHQKLIAKLLEMTLSCLRKWKKKNSSQGPAGNGPFQEGYPRFWLHNPSKRTVPGVYFADTSMSELESQIIQLYTDETSCFCPSGSYEGALTDEHCISCENLRNSYFDSTQHDEISGALKQLFSVTRLPSSQLAINNADNGRNEGYELHQHVHGDQDYHAMYENDIDNEQNWETGIEDEDSDLGEKDSATLRDPNDDEYVSWISVLLPNVKGTVQFLESALSLLQFLLLEHTGMPYVGRLERKLDRSESQNPNNSSMISFTEHAMASHENLINAMKTYVWSCMHFQERGQVQTVPCQCKCLLDLKAAVTLVNAANPILGSFCQELLKLQRPLPVPHSNILASLMELMKLHAYSAKIFFAKLEGKLSPESWQYWERHKAVRDNSTRLAQSHTINTEVEDARDDGVRNDHSNSEAERREEGQNDDPRGTEGNYQRSVQDEVQESLSSGMCFPGRLSSRPCMVFKCKLTQSCRKNYKKSKSHTPGLLTVECACQSPKLIGFVIMTEAESISLALSAVLSHFGIPPRTVYYDNACNMFTSTLLRVPWLLGQTRLAVDRFHYKHHKCCAYFNPDSYRQYDMERTGGAESINSRIKTSLNSIRYLNGDNLIWFLRSRFSFVNLKACYQQKYDRTDMEDVNLTKFFQEIFTCRCDRCKNLEKQVNEPEIGSDIERK